MAPTRWHISGRLNLATLFGPGGPIGQRLIVLVVTFSSVITLVISAIQLLGEYRELRSDLDVRLDQVENILPSMAMSVWAFDDKQIDLSLRALIRQPGIERARISIADKEQRWVAGNLVSSSTVTRHYPLLHDLRGQATRIAVLEVDAGLNSIYRHVADHALAIVLGNGLKTFLVVIFMVVVIRRLVTDRLEEMANNIEVLLQPPAALGVSPSQGFVLNAPDDLDELGRVNWAIEQAAAKLGVSTEALVHLNAELQKRITARTHELEELNKGLEGFSYTLSHDLRAPLRSIAGFVQIVKEDVGDKLDSTARGHIDRIDRAAQRMDSLIDDTVELFRMTSAPLVRQATDFSAIARGVAGDLAATAPQRRVIWNIGTNISAEADPGLLRSVLENLIAMPGSILPSAMRQ